MSGGGLAERKAKLRRHYRQVRKAIPSDERETVATKSAEAVFKIWSNGRGRCERTIGVYVSGRYELDTDPLIDLFRGGGARLAAPRVVGDGLMEFATFASRDQLVPNAMGLHEPQAGQPVVEPERFDLIIVPSVAISSAGDRLGQGGGFYDRYLAQCPSPPIIATLVFREQLTSELPTEAHDRKLDCAFVSGQMLGFVDGPAHDASRRG